MTIYYDRDAKDKTPEEYSMDATTVGPVNETEQLFADLAKAAEKVQPNIIYDMTFEAKANDQKTDYAVTFYSD
ncbi:MAG: hypothetical protein JWN01_214 [Patescibacteria group bacterium]|nr:hypothetical protein [Patescibacteria group bacterium]